MTELEHSLFVDFRFSHKTKQTVRSLIMSVRSGVILWKWVVKLLTKVAKWTIC